MCRAALALGTALSQALGDRKGIHRFGDFTAPLDEALVHVVLVSITTIVTAAAKGHVTRAAVQLLTMKRPDTFKIHSNQSKSKFSSHMEVAALYEGSGFVMQDLSGRPHLSFDLDIPTERIGTFDTQLVEHFFQSLANTSGMTLHIRSATDPAFMSVSAGTTAELCTIHHEAQEPCRLLDPPLCYCLYSTYGVHFLA